MSVPPDTTRALVEHELPGIQAYALRHGWSVAWDPESLALRFEGKHPRDGSAVRLISDVDGYRALPPLWRFEDPATGKVLSPIPGSMRSGKGSIFHSDNLICAPFSRAAYAENGGPHQDWGGPANWLRAHSAGAVQATSLAAMFATILGHLSASPGMKACP